MCDSWYVWVHSLLLICPQLLHLKFEKYMFGLLTGTKISLKWEFFLQNSFFSQTGEKHPNTHGPTASRKATAFNSVKMIVFYSKWSNKSSYWSLGKNLTKNPKKGRGGGMENCWRVTGIIGREDALILGIFFSWDVPNVTSVTFNYVLVILFLFPLNEGVSPYFHCTVLVPLYRVYTSCFHNSNVSFCCMLHTFVCMMQ